MKRRVLGEDEHGDIISSWLIQLVIFMAIVGFVGYEFLSMATTALTLDGQADQIANVAADAYGHQEDEQEMLEAADMAAEERDVALLDAHVDGSVVLVTVQGTAHTLISHRIGPLDRFTHPSVTRREKWRP